jgi:ATP-dependent helicase HrpB
VTPLPIDAVLPDLIRALRERPNAVIVAPPGAGKTTRVPGALLDSGLATSVVMLEPRRVAARAAARRIASERGGDVGDEVGWHVRFDRVAGPKTRILVVTEGLLVRMLQDDPFLDGVGAVILDEVHERGLHGDLALAMVRRIQGDARPDLRIVAMSATIDPGPLAGFLDAPVLVSEGRVFPVDVRYPALPDVRPVEDAVAGAIREALSATSGDVLAFLPGVRELRWTAERLVGVGVPVRLLYGDLPAADQDAILRPGGPRQVVLATNVAETSVTVPGVTAVVDSGLAKVMRRDPSSGLDRLETVRISRSSADQRAGRAGRLAPGVCWRLWTQREHAALEDREQPEVFRVDLAAPVLELVAFGERPEEFPWFEAPSTDAVAAALALLSDLGALANGVVTPIGRLLAKIPAHPRLARLIVEGHRLGWPVEAARIAAILSERDPQRGRSVAHASASDLIDRLDTPNPALDRVTGHLLAPLRSQRVGPRELPRDEAMLRATLAGYPDRVGRRRAPGDERAVLVGGRGVRFRGSAVTAELFVAVDVDAGERGRHAEGIVRIASAVDPAWLHTTTDVICGFDAASERVTATRRRRYRDLVLDSGPTALPDGETVSAALAEAASADLAGAMGLAAPEPAAVLARLRFLATAMPEAGLPSIEPDALRAVLPELCRGKRSFAELRAGAADAVLGLLTWKQRELLDREAPERLTVPSGSRIALDWTAGPTPILAVKIQELFGLADTPRVASGRVRVVLHLLAPNQRPQQVTDDLASFWRNTWPEVRKELRARYPKHSWPEDPLHAEPQARPPRRR